MTAAVPPIELREIDINVTNLCNLTCVYCSYASTPGRDEPALDASVITALLDDAAVDRQQGRPLQRRRAGHPQGHARPDRPRRGPRLQDADALERPAADARRSSRSCGTAGLRQVLVSLDGPQHQHDWHRQREGLWPKTIAGIRNAVAARLQRPRELRGDDPQRRRDRVAHAARHGARRGDLQRLLHDPRGPRARSTRSSWCRPSAGARSSPRCATPPTSTGRRWTSRSRRSSPGRTSGNGDGLGGGRGDSCLGFLDKCNYVNVLADGTVWPCVCMIDVAPPLGQHPRPPALGDPPRPGELGVLLRPARPQRHVRRLRVRRLLPRRLEGAEPHRHRRLERPRPALLRRPARAGLRPGLLHAARERRHRLALGLRREDRLTDAGIGGLTRVPFMRWRSVLSPGPRSMQRPRRIARRPSHNRLAGPAPSRAPRRSSPRRPTTPLRRACSERSRRARARPWTSTSVPRSRTARSS